MEQKLINNKKFLEILRDKLSRGNKKSIHLNAVPGRSATRIDILEIDLIKKGFSKIFINKLLNNKTFKLDITFDDDFDINTLDEKIAKRLIVSIRRLKSICKQNNDYYQEHGLKPFGFGYPIILKRDTKDPSNIIKAPLIIWSLEIEEDRKQVNKWTIKREEDYPIYLNEVLISHIEKDEEIKISKINKEFLDDFILDVNELCKVSSDFLGQFGSSYSQENVRSLISDITKCEIGSDEEKLLNRIPKISGAGVFGLFINQKQTIIEDFNLFIERDSNPELPDLINENFKINPFAAIDTDPSQQSVLNNLSSENRLIIHGPPGTGKSQSLTAVITNALANHAKCLIVCEKRTALDVIYNNLKSLELDRLIALIEDTSKDRRKIVDIARDTIDDLNKTTYKYYNYRFNNEEFANLLGSTKQLRDDILDYHRHISEQIFNEDNWTDLVGQFLNTSKHLDIIAFDKLINRNNGYEFNHQEFLSLSSKVSDLNRLLSKYNPRNNPLEFLIFESVERIDFLLLTNTLEGYLETYKKLHQNLINLADKIFSQFNHHLKEDSLNHYESITKKIQVIEGHYNKYSNSALFHKNMFLSNSVLLIASIFSQKLKSLRLVKNEFIETFNEIEAEIKDYGYVENFSIGKKKRTELKSLLAHSSELFQALSVWHTDLDSFIDLRKREISIINNSKFGPIQNTITEFAKEYDHLLRYHKTTSAFSFTYPGGEESIEVIMNTLNENHNHLQNIKSELNTVYEFLEWKRFYNNLKPNEQIIADAIIKTDTINGEKLFKSWYLNKTLFKHSNKHKGSIEHLITEVAKNGDSLKTLTKKKILTYWQSQRINSIYRYNNSHVVNAKQLFAKTNKAGRKQSLRSIIHKDFDLFTDIFPVVMVNPSVCSSILPLKENLFDVVIFDEASQLRIEDTFCALIRGRIKIVSGDEHQMPPSSYFQSNEYFIDTETEDVIVDEEKEESQLFDDAVVNLAYQESLLDYASELGYKDVDLQIHYRSRHPLLINFSNAAFYGLKLNPLPEKFDFKPVRFINAGGKYLNQVNEIEAKQVINILKTYIYKNESGNYPSIGIATFNIHQRNLIIDEINREANADPEFSIKVDLLYENGLFIKNLENIQGDERDIIIISTTFGPNNNGLFAERFGPLNTQVKGHRLLNVIITRAKYKIFVCSSFPDEKIASYKEHIMQYGNIGRGVLYAYLAYAKAIESSNWESVDYILSLLSERSSTRVISESNLIGTESPFEQEVLDFIIQSGFPENRLILQYKCGGFRIDIAILSRYRNKPIIAIECDGASYHSSNEAYLWDTFRQKQLEEYGLKFYRIWSTNWWINPKKELDKLLHFINLVDSGDSDLFSPTNNDQNFEDFELLSLPVTTKEVQLHSIVRIRSINDQKDFTVKLVDNPQLSIRHGDLQPIYYKSPLAQAILGKHEGDSFDVELSGKIFNVLEILN